MVELARERAGKARRDFARIAPVAPSGCMQRFWPRQATIPLLEVERRAGQVLGEALHLGRVTVAPITTTVRGLSTEIPVSRANGLEAEGVVNCDNIITVPTATLGRQIGFLLPAQEAALTTAAVHAAFDVD